MRTFHFLTIAAALLPAAAQAQSAPPTGKAAFAPCMACHGTKPGETRMGPSMAGVVGRKAATVSGYNYSQPMQKSGIVWTDAKLDAFMANPKAVVPGTKMFFQGVKSAGQRQAIVAYLKSLPAK